MQGTEKAGIKTEAKAGGVDGQGGQWACPSMGRARAMHAVVKLSVRSGTEGGARSNDSMEWKMERMGKAVVGDLCCVL